MRHKAMSKKHEREQRILERLQNENKTLKQEVKSLRNSIRKLNRGYHKLVEEEVIEVKDLPKPAKLCFDCGKAQLERKTVLNRYWWECPNADCGKRTKTKVEKS